MKRLLIVTVLLTVIKYNVKSIKRDYYLVATEVIWNYMPNNTTLYTKNLDKYNAAQYVEGKEENVSLRIGRKYKKTVFRGYQDSEFKQHTETHPWWGILGPPIAAEIGDEIRIHVWNNASHAVTFHTHGPFYDQDNEGSYHYNVSDGGNRLRVGENFTYNLNISEEHAPTTSDQDCLVLTYHSHYHGDVDIITGLVGPLVICKAGKLTNFMSVPPYILLFMVFDENESLHIDENIENFIGNLNDSQIEALKEDEDFMESNRKYSINGLLYDNLDGIKVCCGQQMPWHLIGFGNEIDFHSVVFGGHSIIYNSHRSDLVHVTPGLFLSVTTSPTTHRPGNYSIKSKTGNFFHKGMQASFEVEPCNCQKPTSNGKIRHYYIKIKEISWNYAPTEMDMITKQKPNKSSESFLYMIKDNCTIGSVYKKAIYKEYLNESFVIPKPSEAYMGLLGPVIRAEVGETLKVTVLNEASHKFNFHSTAFTCEECDIESEEPIAPGDMKTYEFIIDQTHEPTDNDHACINWQYSSNAGPYDQHAGLIGVLITCRPGSLNDDGSEKNSGRQYSLLFAIMDENKSPYFKENIATVESRSECDITTEDFTESNKMHSINGWLYGNLFNLYLCLHNNVVFDLVSIIDENQMHVVHFEENIFTHNGIHGSSVELSPGDHKRITISPDTLGKFKIHCHVNDHLLKGMVAFYTVLSCHENEQESVALNRTQRHYFIAAEEVTDWDYSANQIHPIYGENLVEHENSQIFLKNDDTHIGSKYKKVIYREYTDETFEVRKPHDENLGILGPIIRGEVYDTIRVTFLNLASREYNMQPQGLLTMTHGTPRSAQPGQRVEYTWFITEKSIPSKNEFQSTNLLYYSSVDVVRDTQSGLIGMIVIYKPGTLAETGLRSDNVKEFAVLFAIMDENKSWYLDWNVRNYCRKPEDVDYKDEEFVESNLMHAINGRLYGSLKGLEAKLNDNVTIYLCGLGNEVDIHTAHFHGLSAIVKEDASLPHGHREDVVELLPSTCKTAEMHFTHRGKWLFHCHVLDHMAAGMMTTITIT